MPGLASTVRPCNVILSSDKKTESTNMVRFFKYAFIAFSIFAIYTAAPPYKLAIYNGVVAYAQAMKEACLRRDGPCGYAEAIWKVVSLQLDSIETSRVPIAGDT